MESLALKYLISQRDGSTEKVTEESAALETVIKELDKVVVDAKVW